MQCNSLLWWGNTDYVCELFCEKHERSERGEQRSQKIVWDSTDCNIWYSVHYRLRILLKFIFRWSSLFGQTADLFLLLIELNLNLKLHTIINLAHNHEITIAITMQFQFVCWTSDDRFHVTRATATNAYDQSSRSDLP